MIAIQYFLVSIFLFCDKTYSDKLTAQILKKSVSFPTFGLTSPENDKLIHYFPKPKIHTFLRYIHKNNIVLFDENPEPTNYETSKNRLTINDTVYNPLKLPYNLDEIIDNVDKCSKNIIHIYEDVLYLLIEKWKLLHEHNNDILKDYPQNLGFDEHTMNLINRSMTELMHLQRRGKLIVNQLASAYIYTFDLKNIFKNDQSENEEKNNIIKEQFSKYLINYEYYRNMFEKKKKSNVSDIIKNLEKTLNDMKEKVKTSFGITVPLMKNWALITDQENETIKNLQQSMVKVIIDEEHKKIPLFDAASLYLLEANFPQVNENHLKVLENIILHMFEFVMKHFELSAELCKNDLEDGDKKAIDGFRTYMNLFMPLFLDRFFEIEGSIDQELTINLLQLLDFMFPDPEDDSKLSILNYSEKNENEELSLDQHIMDMSKLVLNNILNFFRIEDNELWIIKYQIKFENEVPSKDEIINLMEENFKTGMRGLTVFIMAYDVGRSLIE